MDDNVFFRQATLRICGNLEIEEALQSSLQFLKEVMPLDRMFLQCFDFNYGAMRTIATATESDCSKLDLLTPLSEEARASAGGKSLPINNDIFIFKDPQQYAISREMLSYHDFPCKSLIVLLLKFQAKVLGSMVFLSESEFQGTRYGIGRDGSIVENSGHRGC